MFRSRPLVVSIVIPVCICAPSLAEEKVAAVLPRPTPEQLAWQDAELGIMICLDLITFTDLREPNWQKGGRLDPNLYNPSKLNTDQWMEACRAMGAKYTVFVAKWCTGHMQWQTDLYPYGLKQTRWRDGKGDVVKDYVESCRKYGIMPGLYCSVSANAYWEVTNPGLVNWGKGGDAARQAEYARVCEKMLTELWGNYGSLFEVWFDGGALAPSQGGPDLLPILKRLQPKAIVFGGPAENIRWIGNEQGVAGYPCWATAHGPGENKLEHGNPDGRVWLPGECDVPLRNHEWFWNPNEEQKIYSLAALMDMYYKSVGRNCNMIVGVTPNRDGLIPDADMKRLAEFGAEIKRRFGTPLAETRGQGNLVELSMDRPAVVDHAMTMEDIAQGERIREYVIEGKVRETWRELCKGTSVGHKRIDPFEPTEVSAVRLRCLKAVAQPLIRRLAVFNVAAAAGGTKTFSGRKSQYRGFDRHDFLVDGRNTIVVAPKEPANGKPWIWRAEFFDHRPETDIALLARGFHLVYIDVGNTFGCPAAMKHWDALYQLLTTEYGLSRKPVLEGLSRGGLYVYNWAAANPDKVACIYGDNPVCDFKSWPGGRGKGAGSPADWQKLIKDYGFASEQEALAYGKNPIDNLKPLADAKVPLIHVCGDADETVPYAENTVILKERYEKLGGHIEVIVKKGFKHHPHGLDDPTPIVEFILKHTGGRSR
jgi:alpha-L-fucosidase